MNGSSIQLSLHFLSRADGLLKCIAQCFDGCVEEKTAADRDRKDFYEELLHRRLLEKIKMFAPRGCFAYIIKHIR